MAEKRFSVREKLEFQKKNLERKRSAKNSRIYRLRQKEKNGNVKHLIFSFGNLIFYEVSF
jgi:hypothetical protein